MQLGPPLSAYLPDQRWYGDKERRLAHAAVVDVAAVPAGEEWFALAVAEVTFADGGEQSRYFLPLAISSRQAVEASTLALLHTPDGPRHVADALAAPGFPAWLLGQLAGDARVPGVRGEFRWQSLPALADHLTAARAGEARVGGAEQSNSAVRYDEALFIKLFRRLRPGLNPDEEVTRYLATRTPFRRLPLPLGAVTYIADEGTTYPLALAQTFVPSVGDGWSYTLDYLGAAGTVASRSYAPAARRLGERTGQLHLALVHDAGDPAFAPEPISPSDVEQWESELVAKLRETEADLRARAPDLPLPLRRRIAAFAERLPELGRRAGGFRAQLGGAKTRVHGDYHLGQVLRTPDDDWVILDFEGEPARSIAERRAKTSPLKDVAGMLRSFGYARGAALRAVPEEGRTDEFARRLATWEVATRAAFLAGYRAEVEHAAAPVAPRDADAFLAAVTAWELDKAVYEIAYELGNRPDWLDLPLHALLDSAPEPDP